MKYKQEQENTYNLAKGMTLTAALTVVYKITSVRGDIVNLECQQIDRYGKKQKFGTTLAGLGKQITDGFYVIN